MLTVFNWTEKSRERKLDLARDLGLPLGGHNQVTDVLDSTSGAATSNAETISLQLPPHSVKVLKIVDTSVAAAAPVVTLHLPEKVEAGVALPLSAEADSAGVPVVAYRWDFGDGTHT